MGKATAIGWTDHTFNVVWGCLKVSPGCNHCYAQVWANRLGFDVWGPKANTPRRVFGEKHWNEPLAWNRAAAKEGRRKRVFCSSMADLFEDHPTTEAELKKLWPILDATPWLEWLLLTKRPERIARSLPSHWNGFCPWNVQLGTSIESQEWAAPRLDALLRVSARVHFVSAEPLLGPLDLTYVRMSEHRVIDAIEGALTDEALVCGHPTTPFSAVPGYKGRISWVIAGGESQVGARPADDAWFRSLRRQCSPYASPVASKRGAAFYLKQLGGHPYPLAGDDAVLDGTTWTEYPPMDETVSA